ncbi:lytic polysaccharide monooxygenase [Parathielavia appendiculata]|uniref:lytic cellulose monooxygenase (C4-dehydrogenating) n=1 Tax=Parathielavia appendiculata TaxID=2587402 RepID=A0AAN6TXY4_9PEZI|nr:lytic polysaccharide monooxygenase [Parathielavia appendiculata]
MLLSLATLALALTSTALGHAFMYGIFVNGKDQGDGRNITIRSPSTNHPVRDFKSDAIACNNLGDIAAPNFVKAAAGDKLAFRWYHWNPVDPADILDKSHKGAILTYIAKYATADVSNGTGPIWSKIDEQGFENGEWATIKMINNGGKAEFTLPKALAPDKYLIRQELLALHMADISPKVNASRGAESYPSCVQFDVSGSGNAVPNQNFDFNTGYSYDGDAKGLTFNIHIPFDKYTPPGPKVWTGN